MSHGDCPPIFGPSAMLDASTHEPRSGKCALTNELMTEAITGNSQALFIFAPPRVGMSRSYPAFRLTGAEAAEIIDND